MKSKLNEVVLQIWDDKVAPLFEDGILSEATMMIKPELTEEIFKQMVDEEKGHLISVRAILSIYDPVSPMIIDFYYKNKRVEGTGYTTHNTMRDILKDCIVQDTNQPINMRTYNKGV